MDFCRIYLPLALGAVLATVAACSSDDSVAGRTTSWLGPLASYERAGGTDESGIYVLKTGRPVPAERIRLDRAEITVSAQSDLDSVAPGIYEQIRARFEDALARELSKQPVNTDPDASMYIVRIALTNLTAKRIGQPDQDSALEDLKFSFEGASLEAELRDRRTNTRHAVAIVPARANPVQSNGLNAVFGTFAERISQSILAARTELTRRASAPPAAAPSPKN